MNVCLHVTGAHGSQKRLWVPQKLELGLIASHHVGARNQTLKTSALNYGAISPALELVLW